MQKTLLLILLMIPIRVFSQEALVTSVKDPMDSVRSIQLEELVVTGQYEPQSAENSVYHVRTIGKVRIQKQGAATLNEVLTNELNIRLSQDLAIGNSSLSIQGISGNNVKILLDGVPLVGRNGNGNDVDLYQVNLQDVEKIEIVEGPMAVNYGANALAGVINIITKKSSTYTTSVSAMLHEETAGQEYGLDRGRHIQSLSLRRKISNRWYAQGTVTHNDFKGFRGNYEGRQREWNPKEQWMAGGLLKYSIHSHEIYYKLDFLDENILAPGQVRHEVLPSGVRMPYAFDEEYHTQRLIHHLQTDGKLGKARYSFTASYSDFERTKSRYSKNLDSGAETLTTASGDQDTSAFSAWVLRGSLTGALNATLSFQAGYDINLESASGGRISGNTRSINDYGVYTSVEWLPLSWVKMRPGVRYALNSVYDAPVLPSLNLKIDIAPKTSLRLAYGRGYRAPTVRELYFEFVDSNHRIFGNDQLEPEYSHHIDGSLSRNIDLGVSALTLNLGGFYNEIDNLITISQSATDATASSYVNVLRHKTHGIMAEQQYAVKNVTANIGFSYTGRYDRFSETDSASLKKYFYSPEVNASIGYAIPNVGLDLNLFYKYTGKLRRYRNSEDGNGVEIGEVENFHWLDFTFTKAFGESITLNGGVKNLLDVTRIGSSFSGGGGHSGGSSLPVSYGRSYFLRLTYNLNHGKSE